MLMIIILIIISFFALYMSFYISDNLAYRFTCRFVAGITSLSGFVWLYRLDSFKEMINDMKLFIEQHPYWIIIGVVIALFYISLALYYCITYRKNMKKNKNA